MIYDKEELFSILSHTWREFHPDIANVDCIFVSRGFRQKYSFYIKFTDQLICNSFVTK